MTGFTLAPSLLLLTHTLSDLLEHAIDLEKHGAESARVKAVTSEAVRHCTCLPVPF